MKTLTMAGTPCITLMIGGCGVQKTMEPMEADMKTEKMMTQGTAGQMKPKTDTMDKTMKQ